MHAHIYIYMHICNHVYSSHIAGQATPGEVKAADKIADQRKTLKSIMFPQFDADGLPSSYALKVTQCLAKWRAKMSGLADTVGDLGGEKELLDTSWDFLCILFCYLMKPCLVEVCLFSE